MKAALASLCCLALLSACGAGPIGARPDDGLDVAAAFYPIAFLSREVVGDRGRVSDLTPPGVEPHDIELTAGQVATLARSDLLVYAGGGFQPAVETLAGDVPHALDVLEAARSDAADPHVWLNPAAMERIVGALQRTLVTIDEEGAADYEQEAREILSRLKDLDREFRDGLESCERHVIVTSHEAYGHLAARYGLTQIGIAGIDPQSEPSPDRLAEVTRFVRRHDVTTIFFETLLSPRIAETIADEVGATVRVLDPLENRPKVGDYLTAMRANLATLREALGCK